WIATYFYIQRDYISNNLCVNRFDTDSTCKGKCYLAQELKENEKKQEQQLPDLKQKEIQLLAANEFTFNLSPVYNSTNTEKTPITDMGFVSSGFVFSIFHPPKQA